MANSSTMRLPSSSARRRASTLASSEARVTVWCSSRAAAAWRRPAVAVARPSLAAWSATASRSRSAPAAARDRSSLARAEAPAVAGRPGPGPALGRLDLGGGLGAQLGQAPVQQPAPLADGRAGHLGGGGGLLG